MSETTAQNVDERAPLLENAPSEPSYSGAQLEDGAVAKPSKGRIAAAKVIIPMSVGIFLAAMDGTIVAASYATIGSELKQLQNTSWIATGYMLTMTSFQPLYGKLSDIFGRKPCLISSYIIFALGCLFCGLARNMTELVAARALAGIGGGGMSTVGSILMSDLAPLRERGTWQGMANMVWALGQVVGAPLGGYLADTIGWRWSFLVQVPMALIAIVSVSLALKLPNRDTSDFKTKFRRIDFGGSISLVSAIFSLLLAMDRGGNVSWSDHITIGCLVASAVLFVLFVFIEVELAAEPIAPKRIVVNRSLLASYLTNFFSAGTGVVQAFMITLYFQAVRGRTASEAGVVLIPSITAAVAGSLIGGIIMQATGKYYRLTAGAYVGTCLGAVLIPGFTGVWTYSYAGIAVGLAFQAYGVGTGITTTLIALIANAGPEDQAVATAVSYLFRSLGTVVFLSLATTLMQDSLRHFLYERLTGEDVDTIIERVRESLTYIGELEPVVRGKVIASYADAIHVAMWFTLALCVCSLVSACFIKEKALTR